MCDNVSFLKKCMHTNMLHLVHETWEFKELGKPWYKHRSHVWYACVEDVVDILYHCNSRKNETLLITSYNMQTNGNGNNQLMHTKFHASSNPRPVLHNADGWSIGLHQLCFFKIACYAFWALLKKQPYCVQNYAWQLQLYFKA